MIDVHTHTLLSDGVLVPAEFIRRCEAKGYKGLALTDHVDNGTMEVVIPVLLQVCREIGRCTKMKLGVGAEITHCRPEQLKELVERARTLGAQIVLVHGETIVEPVVPGTNRAAIEAGADILTHPGLISSADARRAAKKGVYLEISGRKGHCLANGHVFSTGKKAGAAFVFGSDAHAPEDIHNRELAENVLVGAGMTGKEIRETFARMGKLLGM
jgi:histidinol phosphatase-like PHP family hydrolase